MFSFFFFIFLSSFFFFSNSLYNSSPERLIIIKDSKNGSCVMLWSLFSVLFFLYDFFLFCSLFSAFILYTFLYFKSIFWKSISLSFYMLKNCATKFDYKKCKTNLCFKNRIGKSVLLRQNCLINKVRQNCFSF